MAEKTATPTDDLTTVGGYQHKEKLSQLLVDYRDAFYMIALVHEQGTYKYDCYSWLTNPMASNSTIIENIDALLRHLSAHSMGRIMDPEGLPHLFHMACRAGMLITTYWRSYRPLDKRYKPERNKEHISKDNTTVSFARFGWQIQPEELYSLSKEDFYSDITTPEELTPLIFSLLMDTVDKAYTAAANASEEPLDTLCERTVINAMEKQLVSEFGPLCPKGMNEWTTVPDIIFKQILKLCQAVWKRDRDTIYKPLMTNKEQIIKTPQMAPMLENLGITF